jgi:hypothetical protein
MNNVDLAVGITNWSNLVEKMNSKKMQLTRKISLENGMCPYF